MVYGIDGCKGGWIAVGRNTASEKISIHLLTSIDDIQELNAEVVAIDIPIGLPDAGPRPCDVLARQRLGKRRSSVFPAPLRGLLSAQTYQEACEIRQAVDGRKISLQTYNILGKIREVDNLLQRRSDLHQVAFEVHPEVSFYAINGNIPIESGKKKKAGQSERLCLLVNHFGVQVETLLERRREFACQTDDLLDACAALWTAERILCGTHEELPAIPVYDAAGLPMRIVF